MPPEAEMDTEPLFEPKHVEFDGVILTMLGDAWLVIVVDVVRLQPFASITITLYGPEDKLLN